MTLVIVSIETYILQKKKKEREKKKHEQKCLFLNIHRLQDVND